MHFCNIILVNHWLTTYQIAQQRVQNTCRIMTVLSVFSIYTCIYSLTSVPMWNVTSVCDCLHKVRTSFSTAAENSLRSRQRHALTPRRLTDASVKICFKKSIHWDNFLFFPWRLFTESLWSEDNHNITSNVPFSLSFTSLVVLCHRTEV